LQSIVITLSVCASVCLSACISACITQKLYGRASRNFLCMLPVALARSSVGNAKVYSLVLSMTLCFHTMGSIGRWTGMALCTSSLVAPGLAQASVGRPAH